MIRGKKYEITALEWILNNIDPTAKEYGGADSTLPDIIGEKCGIVEVKHLPAQSGQFTESTAKDYAYSEEIKALFSNKKNNQNIKHEACKSWVKNYYINQKKVNNFLVFEKEEILFLSAEEYFERYSFSCTYRFKKSGSRNATKTIASILSKTIEVFWNGKKLYVTDNKLNETYLTIGDKKCYINDEGEVRILASTKNATYIFSVDLKEAK